MPTLTEITDRMRELLAINAIHGGKDIVAASPWVTEPGSFPFRIVLRDRKTEFVVHTQSVDAQSGVVGFYWGDYYPKSKSSPHIAFAKAWEKFVSRANHSVGSPPSLEDCDVA